MSHSKKIRRALKQWQDEQPSFLLYVYPGDCAGYAYGSVKEYDIEKAKEYLLQIYRNAFFMIRDEKGGLRWG